MTTTVGVVQRRHMFSLRHRPRGLLAILALPVGFSPSAAIRLSLAHIVSQATAGCIAARMGIGQAGRMGLRK